MELQWSGAVGPNLQTKLLAPQSSWRIGDCLECSEYDIPLVVGDFLVMCATKQTNILEINSYNVGIIIFSIAT